MKVPENLYTQEQLNTIKHHGLVLDLKKDFSNDEIVDIYETLADMMMDNGFIHGEPNKNCAFWEKIFDTWQDATDND